MADVVFVALTLAFFAGAALLVRACDRVIGPDPVPGAGDEASPTAGDPIERAA